MHARNLKTNKILQRVHKLLSDGRQYSTRDIVHKANVCDVGSIVRELRENDVPVSKAKKIGKYFYYRLEGL